MDADEDQKTPQFITLAAILRGLDLSAPEVYATRPRRGLILMEDFGSGNIGRMIDRPCRRRPSTSAPYMSWSRSSSVRADQDQTP